MNHQPHYVFDCTPVDTQKLVKQVAQALEKRTEAIGRKAHPKLWSYTDRLRAREKAPEPVRKRRKAFRIIADILLLLAGILLLLPAPPGVQQPPYLFFVGAFGVTVGGVGLFATVRKRKSAFLKPARQLLQSKDQIIAGENQILFTHQGMEIHTPADQIRIPYSDVTFLVETRDIFLITYQEYVTVLQKKDLTTGEIPEFRTFLSANISEYILCS